jgi:hypothetical protein
LNVMGRGAYNETKECCLLEPWPSMNNLTEEELEEVGIHTQLEDPVRLQNAIEFHGIERNEQNQDPTGLPWTDGELVPETPPPAYASSSPSSSSSEEGALVATRWHENVQRDTLPAVDEEWTFEGETEEGHKWTTHLGKPDFTALHRTVGPRLIEGGNYRVVYRDYRRIAFDRPGQREPTVETIRTSDELPKLIDVLEPGDIWEIITSGTRHRVWSEVKYFPLEGNPTKFACQELPQPRMDFLKQHTPYKLLGWTRLHRRWEDQITHQIKIEHIIDNEDALARRELNATGSRGQISIATKMNGRLVKAMIDSGATGNFMAPQTILKEGYPTQTKRDTYILTMADGKPMERNNGRVDTETKQICMEYNGHEEWIQFDVASIGNHQAILGMPWIRKHNPEINWETGVVLMNRCSCRK